MPLDCEFLKCFCLPSLGRQDSEAELGISLSPTWKTRVGVEYLFFLWWDRLEENPNLGSGITVSFEGKSVKKNDVSNVFQKSLLSPFLYRKHERLYL